MNVVPTRDAATVVIVRRSAAGGHRGADVLLLKRTHTASFVAGAHVFPGGGVDDDDAHTPLAGQAHPGPGDRFVVAAIRECFEEAGILFAHRMHPLGTPPDPIDDADRIAWRRQLAAGERTFRELVANETLALDASPLQYWARWVTPVGSPKRFDARFFLAPEPVGQSASPDDREVTESVWMNAEAAIERADRGEMLLILPTRMTLLAIAALPWAELVRNG